jgi:hypothetical protein
MKADALDFALHAVAACCRKCAHYWHGLEMGRPLTEDEIAYLSELARRYLDARMPDLPEEGQRVPRRVTATAPDADGNVMPMPSASQSDNAPLSHRHAS